MVSATQCHFLMEELDSKCTKYNQFSHGGLPGFWSQGKLPLAEMVLVVFPIFTGISFVHLTRDLGIKVSKNTWTRYMKDVDIVCGEDLEQDRWDPNCKWCNTQWDETTFIKKKYGWGRPVR